MRRLFRWIFRLSGWKVGPSLPPGIRKAVVVAAPHTSNWDFVYAMGALDIMGLNVRFTIKKEWMKFPLILLIGPLGGLPIDRSPKKPGEERRSMVDAMADLFQDKEDLVVIVTPEGTRKRVDQWKTGFYHVALKAGVPILCGYLDYSLKEGGIKKIIYPKPELFETHMREIMEFYKQFQPKNPEGYSPDKDFV